MKAMEIVKDMYWVGAVDYNKRDFHGYTRSPHGTTYNSYLLTDEKNLVFDAVDSAFAGTLLARIASVIPLRKVDYLVVNHTERDHAGALEALVEATQPEAIFTSPTGKKFMEAQFDIAGWPVKVVKTGDEIAIGRRTIRFVETPMLHWPDSMMSYVAGDRALITNDAFGQNIACPTRYSHEFPRHDLERALTDYYYNIVLPFSGLVTRAIDKIVKLGWPIDMICPDHGLIFRTPEECRFAIDSYLALAAQKPAPRALVVYDTMWGSTRMMAEMLIEALAEEGIPCSSIEIQKNHHTAVMSALADCGAVLVGSPTHNNNIMPEMADALTYMKGLKPKNRIGAAFGSYGWSGEAPGIIQDWLGSMGMEMPAEPWKVCFVPREGDWAACRAFAGKVAQALKAKCAAAQDGAIA